MTMKKVMIIDGNQTNLNIMDKVLTKAGFKTDCIVKPIFAIPLIKETKPNLLLLEVDMPEINGFQLCKQIKRDKEIKDLPIIFVSSLSDSKYIAGGLALGAVDYIRKPIIPEELIARVSVHMELAKTTKKLIKKNDMLQTELNLMTLENLDTESDFIYSLLNLKAGKENPNDIERVKRYLTYSFETLIANSPYKKEFNKEFIIDIIKKYL